MSAPGPPRQIEYVTHAALGRLRLTRGLAGGRMREQRMRQNHGGCGTRVLFLTRTPPRDRSLPAHQHTSTPTRRPNDSHEMVSVAPAAPKLRVPGPCAAEAPVAYPPKAAAGGSRGAKSRGATDSRLCVIGSSLRSAPMQCSAASAAADRRRRRWVASPTSLRRRSWVASPTSLSRPPSSAVAACGIPSSARSRAPVCCRSRGGSLGLAAVPLALSIPPGRIHTVSIPYTESCLGNGREARKAVAIGEYTRPRSGGNVARRARAGAVGVRWRVWFTTVAEQGHTLRELQRISMSRKACLDGPAQPDERHCPLAPKLQPVFRLRSRQ